MKKLIFSLLAFVAMSMTVNAQLAAGKVVMEVSEVSSDIEQVAATIGMLKGSTSTVYFDGDKSMSEMSMMGGMVSTKNYVDNETGKTDMLMDAMGTKMWIPMSKEEAEKMTADAAGGVKPEVTYDKKDTKKILGYDAYKAYVKMNVNGQSMEFEGYITEAIKAPTNAIQGTQGIEFAGFPLEITMRNQMMNMTIVVKEIEKDFDRALLTPKTDGFQKMSMEEFTKAFGGMGGMGF